MTPKQEAAARQALHRLQAHTDTADLDAIAALNEALAEQQAAEPVAWANPNDLQNFDMKVRTNGGPLHTVPLYTHPAPAQPPLTDERVIECAARLVAHADFQLGGVLGAHSKPKEIPSNAVSKVKARHLAALRDALAAHGITSKEGGAA